MCVASFLKSALKSGQDIRLTNIDNETWLIYNNYCRIGGDEWVVYKRKKYAHTTTCLYMGSDLAEAIQHLQKGE